MRALQATGHIRVADAAEAELTGFILFLAAAAKGSVSGRASEVPTILIPLPYIVEKHFNIRPFLELFSHCIANVKLRSLEVIEVTLKIIYFLRKSSIYLELHEFVCNKAKEMILAPLLVVCHCHCFSRRVALTHISDDIERSL